MFFEVLEMCSIISRSGAGLNFSLLSIYKKREILKQKPVSIGFGAVVTLSLTNAFSHND